MLTTDEKNKVGASLYRNDEWNLSGRSKLPQNSLGLFAESARMTGKTSSQTVHTQQVDKLHNDGVWLAIIVLLKCCIFQFYIVNCPYSCML